MPAAAANTYASPSKTSVGKTAKKSHDGKELRIKPHSTALNVKSANERGKKKNPGKVMTPKALKAKLKQKM